MTDGREIVRTLEQELEATQQRCGVLERAIESMREIYGISGDVDDEPEAETPTRRSGGKRKKTKKAAAKPKPRTSASSDGDQGEKDGRVLAFITKHPASKIGEILAALSLKPWALKPILARLAKAKQIVIAGKGRGQRVSAKEGL